MKRLIQMLTAICLAFSVMALTAAAVIGAQLPDDFLVEAGQQLLLNDNIKEGTKQGVLDRKAAGESYQAQLSIFGIIPIKDVNVSVVSARTVIPCGTPFGIKMFTDGVVVVGLTDVENSGGMINPAKKAGIQVGDVITDINGRAIVTNEEIAEIISKSNGAALTITYKRDGKVYSATLNPVKAKGDNRYKAGIWVRDSSAGIGTITFYDPTSGLFGGLGHPVCDVDTGEILPLMSGEVVNVTITGVTKGIPGLPGELKGSFNSNGAEGSLIVNTQAGLYGMLNQSPSKHTAMPVALKQQVKEGRATILSTIDGMEPREYEIMIEKVDMGDTNPTKNLIIRITDPKLLNVTGGIVQGMSGSPILQDGMLVGAVTHVFVNDPARGYGIFAENMLNQAESLRNTAKAKAS